MDFFKVLKSVVLDVKDQKGYKALKLPVAIIFFILMLPVSLVACILYLFLIVLSFLMKYVSFVRDYLEKYLESTTAKEKVHPATQAVAYFIGYPIVFGLSIPLGICYMVESFVFFIFECVTYVATLGGTSFQPFILEYNEDKPKQKVVLKQKTGAQVVMLVLVLVFLAIAVLSFVFNGTFLDYMNQLVPYVQQNAAKYKGQYDLYNILYLVTFYARFAAPAVYAVLVIIEALVLGNKKAK